MKITIIGAGNMGGALAKGWAKVATNNNIVITVTARSQSTLDKIKVASPTLHCSQSNTEAIQGADIIVLAVKPWLIGNVVEEIRHSIDADKQILVSVAAGITTDKLAEMFNGSPLPPLYYAMPNIAAEYGESMTFVAAAANCTDQQTKSVADLFRLVGQVKVCEERMIAPGMMMAGCGIAYVMRYLRAQMEGGVEMGFYPADALSIALQTMQGAVTLLKETGLHPEAAIDKVTTPGGTTIKGLNELDHSGFNSAVINSLKAGLK
jgi:pyrroline-5-carboxylate reductase